MSKKKVDYSTAGLSVLRVKSSPSNEEEQVIKIASLSAEEEMQKKLVEQPESITPKGEKSLKDSLISSSSAKKQSAKFISRTYYVTPEQYKALKLRVAISDDPQEKDISAIVRAALDQYLENELRLLTV